MKDKSSVSVIIPVFNEEQSLLELNKRLEKTLKNYEYELIYINDGSTDKSLSILKKLSLKNDQVKIISFENNKGLSAVYNIGFKKAKKKLIATIDSDLQINPEDIPLLISKLNEDYDVVIGWRKNRKDSFLKVRMPSLIYNFLLRILFQIEIHDAVCPLKIFRSKCLRNFNLRKAEHRILIPSLKNKKYKITELEISHNYRRYGKSKFFLLRRCFETLNPLLKINFGKNTLTTRIKIDKFDKKH